MRDNSEHIPEIVNAIKIEADYFAIIGIELNSIKKYYRIGISQYGYNSIIKVIQSKPFSTSIGTSYRYFFIPSIMKESDNEVLVKIFIENENQKKQFDFAFENDLVKNLLWFFNIKSFDKITGIPEVSRDGRMICMYSDLKENSPTSS